MPIESPKKIELPNLEHLMKPLKELLTKLELAVGKLSLEVQLNFWKWDKSWNWFKSSKSSREHWWKSKSGNCERKSNFDAPISKTIHNKKFRRFDCTIAKSQV